MMWTARIIRVLLGAILLSTALGKALDVPGFVQVVLTYDVLGETLAWPAAVLMVVTEFVLAIWLFSGKRLAHAGAASAVLHMVFTLWGSVALLRGLELDNCGCFGVFLQRPLTKWTLVEDGVLVALSVVLVFSAVRQRRGR